MELPDKDGDWTASLVLVHFTQVMDERDRRWNDLRRSDNESYRSALMAQKEAVQAALSAANTAVQKAEDQAKEWRIAANEWRAAMDNKDRLLPTRLEVDQKYATLEAQLVPIQHWMQQSMGRETGRSDVAGWIVGGVGFLTGVVGLVVALVR